MVGSSVLQDQEMKSASTSGMKSNNIPENSGITKKPMEPRRGGGRGRGRR
jgi:hypothetical protein